MDSPEEPGRLQSMGSQRVGYDWATERVCAHTHTHRHTHTHTDTHTHTEWFPPFVVRGGHFFINSNVHGVSLDGYLYLKWHITERKGYKKFSNTSRRNCILFITTTSLQTSSTETWLFILRTILVRSNRLYQALWNWSMNLFTKTVLFWWKNILHSKQLTYK